MYERGLAYNTIAAAKSVLSSIIHLPGVVSISDHPLVQRLLKGVFNTGPPTSKYPYIWDTSKLHTLQNDRNDFATMSKKLVTLFTLLSGQRVSTLHKFKRSMMQVLPDRIIFHLSGNLKKSRPANPPEPIIFHQYPHDGELCPVAAFHQYHLTRTAIVGTQFDDSIFLCHRKPNAPATIDTLARWVKQSMIAAGIDTTSFIPTVAEQRRPPKRMLLESHYIRFCELDNGLRNQPSSGSTVNRLLLLTSPTYNLPMLF